MTVVGVGGALRERYCVGDRFIVQSDIFVGGVGYAYGYEIAGGLSQYGIIDRRVLDGDDGSYLLPVRPATGYAESALTEPWACVNSAYGLEYRTTLKPGGITWIVGTAQAAAHPLPYTISAGFDHASHPSRLLLTDVPPDFAAWLRERAAALGIDVLDDADLRRPPAAPVDDIVVLGPDPAVVETVSPHLADQAVLAVIAQSPMPRPVAVDVGRVHYNRWLYAGGPDPDIARAYGHTVHAGLTPGGRAWFAGAGGPMGRMHVQRAVQAPGGPSAIVCTDISEDRLADLSASYGAEAAARGVEWVCLSPKNAAEYEAGMLPFRERGFDNIVVLAPVPAVIAGAAAYLAPGGVLNIFAGVGRGTVAHLDLNGVIFNAVRFIGHSGSSIDDLRLTLAQAEAGALSPNRSVAAVGSLGAARDGLQAVRDTTFAGKIVIYPHINDLPLTALPDLKHTLPTVHARLKDGREWTVEAEEEFLRLMLP
jgi:hypothetical protein